jgi:hypothetical protein
MGKTSDDSSSANLKLPIGKLNFSKFLSKSGKKAPTIVKPENIPILDEEYYSSLLTTNLDAYNCKKQGIAYMDPDEAELQKNPALKWMKDRQDKLLGTMRLNLDTFLNEFNNQKCEVEFDYRKCDIKHVIENTRTTGGALHTLTEGKGQMIKD